MGTAFHQLAAGVLATGEMHLHHAVERKFFEESRGRAAEVDGVVQETAHVEQQPGSA